MIVLVNGIGNIGTSLLSILHLHKTSLGITKIIAHKNNPLPWNHEDLDYLKSLGIIVCTKSDNPNYEKLDKFIHSVDYIFDCTANGGGIENLNWYKELPNLKGASAQGSEKNFGNSFMSGINNSVIEGEKFVHVVSCNTHAIASLLTTFCGLKLNNLDSADFVIVRRSEDLGNHERLVSANVVARHMDNQVGTHHSIDVIDLFKTIDKKLKVTSSDITTPSQLMHGIRFNIQLKQQLDTTELENCLESNAFISTSTKFDSNKIFERGRRISPQGRIYSHAIIIKNNLMQIDTNLIGWAFIPQEGNTLLSTLNAFLLQIRNSNEPQIMAKLVEEMIYKKW